MEDKDIVRLYLERSEDAISETAKKYGRYCHNVAYKVLENDADAEECVNDTYLRVWNSIPPQRPNNFMSYITRITRNLSLDRYRAARAEKRGGGEICVLLSELEECVPDTSFSMTEGEITAAINRFLSDCDEFSRKVFIRRYWFMQNATFISRMYGVSRHKVNVTLEKTRAWLEEYLRREGIRL